MVVPKMVKNRNNSVLGINNYSYSPFEIHALKTDPTSDRWIKTISHQLRNTHAR